MSSFQYATLVCNIIASVSVISALLVITVSNPVSSVLWLITAFIAVACYLVTAGMTYIGLSYVIVYVRSNRSSISIRSYDTQCNC